MFTIETELGHTVVLCADGWDYRRGGRHVRFETHEAAQAALSNLMERYPRIAAWIEQRAN